MNRKDRRRADRESRAHAGGHAHDLVADPLTGATRFRWLAEVLAEAERDHRGDAPSPVADEREPRAGLLHTLDGRHTFYGGQWVRASVDQVLDGKASAADGSPLPPPLTFDEERRGPSASDARSVAATRHYQRRVAASRGADSHPDR